MAELTNNELLQVMSDTLSRIRLAGNNGISHSGARDLWSILGYKRDLVPDDFADEYNRGGIASRIIKAFPAATWRDPPTIEDGEGETEFKRDVERLGRERRLWHYLSRADRLAGIGRYGLLVLGLDDGALMSEEVSTAAVSKLLWMRPASEETAEIKTYETRPESPRYGLPLTYGVTFGSDEENGKPSEVREVHHSRVIHIAEHCEGDDVFGQPRLEPVYNYLRDLEKVVGGSAEMFWLSARAGLQFIADKDASLDADAIDQIKKNTEEFQHQLRRALAAKGGKWEMLTAETPDPTGNVATLLDLIAGATGIPKRILIGSERGELSSTQDENNWLGRINERREQFAVPVIIRPLLQRLIEFGIIAAPKTSEWSVHWEETDGLTEQERVDIFDKKMSALEKYTSALDGGRLMTDDEFREQCLGLEPLTAEDLAELDEIEEDDDAQALSDGRVVPINNDGNLNRRADLEQSLANYLDGAAK